MVGKITNPRSALKRFEEHHGRIIISDNNNIVTSGVNSKTVTKIREWTLTKNDIISCVCQDNNDLIKNQMKINKFIRTWKKRH